MTIYHIYKIVCNDDKIKDVYVGCTKSFKRRQYEHGSISHNPKAGAYNNYLYKVIRNNGGWKNWRMIEITQEECKKRKDALKIENNYIQKMKANLNE